MNYTIKPDPVSKSLFMFTLEAMALIEQAFKDGRGKISRFSVEWGTWSREMNLEIKRLQVLGNPAEVDILVRLYIYWVLASELLEMEFKWKFTHLGRKRRTKKEIMDAKEIIFLYKNSVVEDKV